MLSLSGPIDPSAIPLLSWVRSALLTLNLSDRIRSLHSRRSKYDQKSVLVFTGADTVVSTTHWYFFLPFVVAPSSPTQTSSSSSVAYARALLSSPPSRDSTVDRIPSRHVLLVGSLAGVDGMATNGCVVDDVRRGTGLGLDADALEEDAFAVDVDARLLGVADWLRVRAKDGTETDSVSSAVAGARGTVFAPR